MKARKTAAALLVATTVVLAGLFAVSPVDPVGWTPPTKRALEGPLAPNDRLTAVEWWARDLVGPETIFVEPSGTLLAGLRDGRVVRLTVGKDEPQLVVDTHGRPLAMQFHPDGRLIIADAHRGLLSMDQAGALTVLVEAFEGKKLVFVDDLAITHSGDIYFTDASTHFSIENFTNELLEHRALGRLFKLDSVTHQVTVVADGFSFANGLSLSGDERFLVVTETASYRLWRVWLEGPRMGHKELFTDALPGFPDNIRWSPSRQGFWVAIGSPRKPEVDALAGFPGVRRVVAALPPALQPAPARHSYVLLVDNDGGIVDSFQHEAFDSYSPVACATEHEGWLYLGSFVREGVARFRLP